MLVTDNPPAGRGLARRWLVPLLLAALLGLTLPGVLRAGPASAANSWKLAQAAEFNGPGLPNGCIAYSGPYAGGASFWSADAATVSGGQLRLTLNKKAQGGKAWTSGGLSCWQWGRTYGRFEIRAKIPAGKGIDSYLSLSPSKGAAGTWTGVELLAPSPETAYITNGYGSGSETARVNGAFSNGFHVYAVEWSPARTRVTVDGNEIFSSSHSYKGARFPGLVVSNGDVLTGVPDASTRLPATFQVDYLRVYGFTGVEPAGAVTPAPAATAAVGPSSVPTAIPTATIDPASASAARPTGVVNPARAGLTGGWWLWLLAGSALAGLIALGLSRFGPRGSRASRGRSAA